MATIKLNQGGQWITLSDDSNVVKHSKQDLTSVQQSQARNNIGVFTQPTKPVAANEGDIWFDTSAAIADYVVEQGTSDNWTYRKWNSGIAELWGIFGHTAASTDYVEYQVAYPFTFTEKPVVTISADGQGGYTKSLSPYNNSTSTTLVNITYKNSTSSSIYSQFNIHVIGTWK